MIYMRVSTYNSDCLNRTHLNWELLRHFSACKSWSCGTLSVIVHVCRRMCTDVRIHSMMEGCTVNRSSTKECFDSASSTLCVPSQTLSPALSQLLYINFTPMP